MSGLSDAEHGAQVRARLVEYERQAREYLTTWPNVELQIDAGNRLALLVPQVTADLARLLHCAERAKRERDEALAKVTEQAAEIDRLTQAAEYAAGAFDQRDAALAKVEAMGAQIAAALVLHARHEHGPRMSETCDGCLNQWWPCPTVRALGVDR